MDLQQRIIAFVKLGEFIQQFSTTPFQKDKTVSTNPIFFDGFNHQIKLAYEHNGWFTKENISFALKNWATQLTNHALNTWLSAYDLSDKSTKSIAVIMAGNIPLVGFHDFLSVLITGHKVIIKQSSNDKHLLPFLAKYLEHVEPEFKGKITFTDDKLTDFDAIIATGSNNTARYFEYYFKDKPSIIRKNKNAVAVLTGEETDEQLKLLSEDIFRFYGLGCRSVSKLFVPQNYSFDAFFNGMFEWHPIIHQAKYANNYDYNKAVYIMSEFNFLDNGFLMIKEDTSYNSPIAAVFYESYEDLNELKSRLSKDKDKIQCVVSSGIIEHSVAFGQTQHPKLQDYADDKDTIEFLLNI